MFKTGHTEKILHRKMQRKNLNGNLSSIISRVQTGILKVRAKLEAFVVTTDGSSDIKYARMAAKEFGIKLNEIKKIIIYIDLILTKIETSRFIKYIFFIKIILLIYID